MHLNLRVHQVQPLLLGLLRDVEVELERTRVENRLLDCVAVALLWGQLGVYREGGLFAIAELDGLAPDFQLWLVLPSRFQCDLQLPVAFHSQIFHHLRSKLKFVL